MMKNWRKIRAFQWILFQLSNNHRGKVIDNSIFTQDELNELEKFCAEYLQKPLEDFISSWPGV